MKRRIAVAVVIVLVGAVTAGAQDALGPARDLYASAAYEEALSALARLKTDAPAATSTSSTEIDHYRALCLMALGRTAEADKVFESIVSSDPTFQPSAADVAPRVRAAFNAARGRVLPGVARSLYLDAKAAFDRKAYGEAAERLQKTVGIIDGFDGANAAGLGDLRTLAAGFLDLSRAALAAAAPPPTSGVAPATTSSAPAAPVAMPDTNLVVLRQELPPPPFALLTSSGAEYRGLIEVEIDEAGRVTNARMLQSVHAFYDPLLLKASRDWRYEAPRTAGKPVASRKRVEVVLRP
jgi:TonB family protein